jgi:hypothetical protein
VALYRRERFSSARQKPGPGQPEDASQAAKTTINPTWRVDATTGYSDMPRQSAAARFLSHDAIGESTCNIHDGAVNGGDDADPEW